MSLGTLGMTLDASGQHWLQFLERRMQQAVQEASGAAACHCLGQAAAGRCQAGTGSQPKILGECKALYQMSALPLHSLGLVLPPYSTYYIQANLSDQILQVKCK